MAAPAERIRAAEVDRVRLERIFNAHHESVWRALRRRGLTPEAAEDATQETFLLAAERLDDIRPESERSFLIATALRVANTLGRVYYLKGLYEDAIPLLKSAVDLDGGAQNTFHLGFAYLKAGEFAKGRQVLNVALKMGPALPEAEEAKRLLIATAKQN